jgi:hypothetical protein
VLSGHRAGNVLSPRKQGDVTAGRPSTKTDAFGGSRFVLAATSRRLVTQSHSTPGRRRSYGVRPVDLNGELLTSTVVGEVGHGIPFVFPVGACSTTVAGLARLVRAKAVLDA